MIHKTFLLNEDCLEEQEKILKYFYLIDPNQIAEDLKELPVPQNNNDTDAIDNLFHTVFEKIFNFSALYNKYINPYLSSTFFGEPGCNKETEEKTGQHIDTLRSLSVFLKLSLRNYCITQGFFYSLSIKNSDSSVPLSAPYDQFLNSGYFINPEYTKTPNSTLDFIANSYQFYNSRYKSLKKLGNNSFLSKMLMDCSLGLNSSIPAGDKRFSFKVPLIYKYWIYFIFMDNKIRNLSRNIEKNSTKISKYYKEIFEVFQSAEKGLSLPIDHFVFHTLGEYYFGFSSAAYINQLLNKVYRLSENKDITDTDSYLTEYRGSILENILSQLSLCPMPYSRHFFLKYAFEALRYNKVMQCQYLSHTPDIAVSRLPTENTIITKEELSAKGLSLIMKYFHTLNNITLPILSCLWKIVLKKLIDDNDLLLNLYKTYIETHYNILTVDFASLSFDDIKTCCCNQRPIVPENDLYFAFSLESLESLIKNSNFCYFESEKTFLQDVFSNNLLSGILHDFLESLYDKPLVDTDYLWQGIQDNTKTEYDFFRFHRAKNIFTLLS